MAYHMGNRRSIPLTVSVALFSIHGVVLTFLAAWAFPFYRRLGERRQEGFLMSERMDGEYFGRSTRLMHRENPQLLEVVDLLMDVRAGLWLAFGIFETSIAWFALRKGQEWSFWTLVLGNLAMWSGYALVAMRFIRRGVRLGFDMPPLIFTVPTFVVPVAAALGWLGLTRTNSSLER